MGAGRGPGVCPGARGEQLPTGCLSATCASSVSVLELGRVPGRGVLVPEAAAGAASRPRRALAPTF